MPSEATRAKELAGLIERVEAATGPDRILDAMIAADVAGLCLHGNWHREGPDGDRGRVCDDCGADSWGNLGKFGQRLNDPLPAYTVSIDAALALVERMLPGEIVGLDMNGDRTWVFWFQVTRDRPCIEAIGPTAPLAILAALLRALIAKEAEHG